MKIKCLLEGTGMDIQFANIDNEKKELILDVLGYYVGDEGFIFVKKTKKKHVCPITGRPVKFERASILPWNSNIVVNTSALTISEYISRFTEMSSGKEGV